MIKISLKEIQGSSPSLFLFESVLIATLYKVSKNRPCNHENGVLKILQKKYFFASYLRPLEPFKRAMFDVRKKCEKNAKFVDESAHDENI